ncbi:hypothetical protein CBF98_09575, partial [Streptococcus pyogenes]
GLTADMVNVYVQNIKVVGEKLVSNITNKLIPRNGPSGLTADMVNVYVQNIKVVGEKLVSNITNKLIPRN